MADEFNQYRPNFKRQMLYAGTLLAAILIAYVLATLITGPSEPELEPQRTVETTPQPENPVKPWYQKQSPPPAMITTPDLPLFPEIDENGQETKLTARAYEEALPKEAYEPPATPEKVSLTPPVKTVEQIQPPSQQVATVPGQLKSVTSSLALPRWRQYAVPAPVAGKAPRIAIVIDDMGVDKKRSAQAIDLKGPLTLSFLTYATELGVQTELARANGHELMLHVSMEPGSKAVDPGPNVLLTGLSESELHRRLQWGFQRFDTYVGINNHMGSKFTSDAKSMSIVLKEIKERGLLFLDSRTSKNTVGAKLARELGVPVAERNIFLDHENTVPAVNRQLRQVEKMARRNGSVIAIGHPRDATIKALQAWLPAVEARGFQLVPLTSLVAP